MQRDPDAERFLLELARELHTRGTSSPRLEAAINGAGRGLGILVQIIASPTSLQMAFGRDADQRAHLLRSDTGPIDLGKMVEIDKLIDAVIAGKVAAGPALVELERIRGIAAPYSRVLEILAFAVTGSAAACLLGGGVRESLAATVLGTAVGLLVLWGGSNPRHASVVDALSAAVASFAAAGLSVWWMPIQEGVVMMSALIVLIPGLSFTAAMSELADRHLISGTARLSGALITFLQLGLGIALGRLAADACFGPLRDGQLGVNYPHWGVWLAVPVAAAAFVVLFRAPWRYLPMIAIVGAIGFFATAGLAAATSTALAGFVGALVVGTISNIHARLFHMPASLLRIPAILLLVPGTVGMRSLSAFLQSDVAGGAQAAFAMILSGIALVGGLLVANSLVTPRRFL